MTDDLGYPVTVTLARYGGAYEPGRWVAFAAHPDQLPPEWDGDDLACSRFYMERRGEIGGGDSPQAAYEHLLRLLRERRNR